MECGAIISSHQVLGLEATGDVDGDTEMVGNLSWEGWINEIPLMFLVE